MALDTTTLLNSMMQAGENLVSGIWGQIKSVAVPELSKIASEIVSVEVGLRSGVYTPDGATYLLNMQVNASIAIVAGMTALTIIDIQAAINAILDAIKTFVNAAIGFALIA